MASRLTRKILLLTGTLLGSALLFGPAAHAQGEGERESLANAETRETPAMRERVYNPLSEAQACAEMGDFECARRLLERVRAMDDLNSYELALMWQFYAFIYFEEDNTQGAMMAYENLLMQDNLPLGLEQDSAYTLAQLYTQEEQYEDALRMLDRWFEISPDPGVDPYILRAQIYYQMQRYADGIEPVLTALDLAEQRGREPQESWYQLLNVFYFELENYPKVIETLRTLVNTWPKKDYLIQLAGMYGQEGEEDNQLALYEAAYEAGWLERGGDYTNLASMLMQADVPYKAAVIMEEKLDDGTVESTESNWRLLAQAWQLAQEDERAIPALSRAAQLSDDGELDVRLANSYANLAQWSNCVDSAREGLRRGGLDNPANANMVLGQCLFEQQEYDQARTAFQAASRNENSRRAAQQWLTYVNSEQQRVEQIEATIAALEANR